MVGQSSAVMSQKRHSLALGTRRAVVPAATHSSRYGCVFRPWFFGRLSLFSLGCPPPVLLAVLFGAAFAPRLAGDGWLAAVGAESLFLGPFVSFLLVLAVRLLAFGVLPAGALVFLPGLVFWLRAGFARFLLCPFVRTGDLGLHGLGWPGFWQPSHFPRFYQGGGCGGSVFVVILCSGPAWQGDSELESCAYRSLLRELPVALWTK